MGSGLGTAQRAIVRIFESEPDARLTVADMAARVYPGHPITRSHTNNLSRVLRNLGPVLGLVPVREGGGHARNRKYRWGKAQ